MIEVVVGEGGADADLDVLGGAFPHHQVVHLFQVAADGIAEFIARHPHRLGNHRALEAEHRHFGGAAADVHDHRAHRLSNRQASADGGGHRFIHQVHLPGATETGLPHGPAFHPGHTAGDADHQPGRHHAAAFIALADEVLDHLFGGIEIGNHAVPQGPHGADVAGGAAQHQLGLFPHRQGNALI